MSDPDELFMIECLALARRGWGHVSPNPMVGCVVVREGKVLSRGFHKKFGGPHAEVEAITSSKRPVRGATIYVNLEPCNITGKTPPCTDLLIKSGISRVVAGMKDPNPKVSGRGFAQLRRSGIVVTTGVLHDECRAFNETFVKFMTTQTPFVTIKIAQTLDGKIADARGRSRWISAEASRKRVHMLRAGYDALLVGSGTVRSDNPRLTVRGVEGKQPDCIILNRELDLDPGLRVFMGRTDRRVLLVSNTLSLARKPGRRSLFEKLGVEVVAVRLNRKGFFDLHELLGILGARGISSVMVEGGAKTFGQFLAQGAADKLICFTAPRILGDGTQAVAFPETIRLGRDVRLRRTSVSISGGDVVVSGYLGE